MAVLLVGDPLRRWANQAQTSDEFWGAARGFVAPDGITPRCVTLSGQVHTTHCCGCDAVTCTAVCFAGRIVLHILWNDARVLAHRHALCCVLRVKHLTVRALWEAASRRTHQVPGLHIKWPLVVVKISFAIVVAGQQGGSFHHELSLIIQGSCARIVDHLIHTWAGVPFVGLGVCTYVGGCPKGDALQHRCTTCSWVVPSQNAQVAILQFARRLQPWCACCWSRLCMSVGCVPMQVQGSATARNAAMCAATPSIATFGSKAYYALSCNLQGSCCLGVLLLWCKGWSCNSLLQRLALVSDRVL
jgi:hypothetical protein